jgi:hypothetical protein
MYPLAIAYYYMYIKSVIHDLISGLNTLYLDLFFISEGIFA